MLTHRNLLMACFAALLALGLAACGTGGNGAAPAAMMDDPVPEPDPDPTAGEMAAATALAAYDEAKGAYDAAFAAYESTPTVQKAYVAKEAADAAKAAAEAAVAAAADGNDAQKAEAAAAVVSADAAVATATTAVMTAEAVDNAIMEAMEALDAYNTAKTTFDAAETTAHDGSVASAMAMQTAAANLKEAADAAVTAAADGTADQVTAAAAAVTYAEGAVARADSAYEVATGISDAMNALDAYDAAKPDFETAEAAYEADGTVENANAMLSAATALKDAADAAVTAAADGTVDQVAAAAAAVAYAENALVKANAAVAVATANADAAAVEAREAQQIEDARVVATTAATEAGGFADAAETDATNAADAAMGRARFQTTPSSYAQAVLAKEHAGYARTAANNAETAAEKAAMAMTVAAAILAQGEAETAWESAKAHRGHVTGYHDGAVAAAAMEVFVIEGGHQVGDTTITIDGLSRSAVVGGKTLNTGLISAMDVTTPGMRTVNGLPIMFDGADVGGRMAADVDIGVTYDSDDDSARLTLVKSYLGTQKQMQFVRSGDNSPFDGQGGRTVVAPVGGQNLVPNTADDDITNGAVTVEANDSHNTEDVTAVPKVAGSDFRAHDATTAGVTLYYVDSGVADTSTGATDDGVDQTKVYLERDSEGGDVTYNVVNVVEVTVDAATDYQHIHFGLWNGLSGDGANTVADLGIGFVAAIADGMGMTEEMPNYGTATYKGNWVANVQEADLEGDGEIRRMDGTSSMVADFGKDEVDVTLTGLITLEGTITGNMFSGTKAAVHDMDAGVDGVQNTSGLAPDAKLEGEFNGGFFGTLAAEAGGVFAFSTDDNEDGAVNGAFGGK